jgi:TetR/AcrR family transcriptional repressor of nem operon
VALVHRYARRFADALAGLDTEPDGAHRLAAYVELYRQVLGHDRMCLCGMLAAEQETLPLAMRAAVDDFFRMNEAWLATALDGGRDDGSLHFEAPAADAAQAVVAGLEGAMLIARLRHDHGLFDTAARRLVGELGAP